MTTPTTEDTPLMGVRSPYQGIDIEHQGDDDASFEEVQDIDRVRPSKSRILLATMFLLAGAAVVSFSTGLTSELSVKFFGWPWGGKTHASHHHHAQNNTEFFQGLKEYKETELKELNASEMKRKERDAKQKQNKEKLLQYHQNKTLVHKEEHLKAKDAHKLEREEEDIHDSLEEKWGAEIGQLEFEKDAVEQYIQELNDEKQTIQYYDYHGKNNGKDNGTNITALIEHNEKVLSDLGANVTKAKGDEATEFKAKKKMLEGKEQASLDAQLKALDTRENIKFHYELEALDKRYDHKIATELKELDAAKDAIIKSQKDLEKYLDDNSAGKATPVQKDSKVPPPAVTKVSPPPVTTMPPPPASTVPPPVSTVPPPAAHNP